MKVHKVSFDDPHPELIGKKIADRTIVEFIGVNNGAIPVYQLRCDCGKTYNESYDTLFKVKNRICKDCRNAKKVPYGDRTKMGTRDPRTKLNHQQELFCQEYVRCWDGRIAATRVGYAELNGYQLLKNEYVRCRIEDLVRQQRKKVEQARDDAARECRIDLVRVTEMLLRDREAALTGRVHIHGKEPEEPHEKWRPDSRAAVQATMGIAQLHGLLIKRTEITVIDAMQQMNDHELVDFVCKLQQKLADKITIDVSPISRLVEDQDVEEDADSEN